MPEQKLFGPIKFSGRALYDDGQMINSNVINHVTKECLNGELVRTCIHLYCFSQKC